MIVNNLFNVGDTVYIKKGSQIGNYTVQKEEKHIIDAIVVNGDGEVQYSVDDLFTPIKESQLSAITEEKRKLNEVDIAMLSSTVKEAIAKIKSAIGFLGVEENMSIGIGATTYAFIEIDGEIISLIKE